MALSEEQIQRYSRQILLRDVGGRGQEALLAARVQVSGTGPAALTAAAYLAAAGVGVSGGEGPLVPAAAGFLASPGDSGAALREVLERALPDFSPDAPGARAAPWARLAEAPHRFEGEPPWVALGGQGARGVVLFCAPAGCRACFARTLERLAPPPADATGVGLGALGALILTRLVLGLPPALGARAWGGSEGGLADQPLERCGRCV